jgi:hypothetical protein
MKKRLQLSLLILVIVMLFLPTLQQFGNLPTILALKGAVTLSKRPEINLKGYFNATLQDSIDKWVEDHIGYRPFLVRLHNQIQYSLFNTISARGVILGKDDYLFEFNYIRALYGLNFVGYVKITRDAEETSFVNEWLKERDKHLLVVLAPGKGSFFANKVPDSFRPDSAYVTNNEVYLKKLDSAGIQVINGNHYFQQLRDTCRFALFPKSGIHWSYYGMGLIFDSILSSMEQMQGKRFIDFGIKKIEVSKQLRSPDQDLWEGMNVFMKSDDYAMPYPQFYFDNPDPEAKPNVIVVADSYYWQWFGSGYATRSFNSHDFWYYNEQIYPGNGGEAIQRHHVDIISRVMETNFVVLLQTDANMDRFSFGFIHDLYLAIQKLDSMSAEDMEAIEKIIAGIKESPDYMKTISEKAAQRHISVEEMLRGDAMWVFQKKKENAALK